MNLFEYVQVQYTLLSVLSHKLNILTLFVKLSKGILTCTIASMMGIGAGMKISFA